VSREAERELEAIRAKMARGELDPGAAGMVDAAFGVVPGTWTVEIMRDGRVIERAEARSAPPVENGVTCGPVPVEFTFDGAVVAESGDVLIMGFGAESTDRTPDLPPGFDLGEVVE